LPCSPESKKSPCIKIRTGFPKKKGKAGFFMLIKNQNKSENQIKEPRNKKARLNAAKTRFQENQKSKICPLRLQRICQTS